MGAEDVKFRYPLDDIRTKTDIVELISTYVSIKRSGKSLKALCPFHTEKTPSFIVNEDLQRWRCYGCGEYGDVFTFLMKIENITFSEAVQELAKRAGITIQRSPAEGKWENDREKLLHINNAAASYFSQALLAAPHAMAYLHKRGVSQESIVKYSLGYAPEDWRALAGYLTSKRIDLRDAEKAGLVIKSDKGSGYYDRFRNRIIFPIQDVTGKNIAFGGRAIGDEQPKYLNSPESPAFAKNKTLYGLNHARKSIAQEDRAIIVEGYLDALTAQCAGFSNTVATMGTALTPEHVNLLSRYTHTAVIAFDSDSAGMSATLRSAPMFEQAGFDVRVLCMPPGNDPDSLLREGKASEFTRLVTEAMPVVEYRLKLLQDSSDLKSDQGKVEMLKKASAILADVASAVERDRYIRGLAQYHPNFSGGATRAEEQIRRDVDNQVTARGRASSRSPQMPRETAKPDAVKSRPSALTLAERCLLKAMIMDPIWGPKVIAELPPEQFATSQGITLASAIANRLAAEKGMAWNDLAEDLAGTEAADLLSELSIADSGPDITAQAVEDCLKRLKIHWKRQRLKDLAARVEQGEIRSSDEEFAEYWRLVQELHNTV
ncbi:MAG: DNA primase [Armatimonadota bacterium]|nr:DNA primase [Armatimonadota bacterium]